MISTAFIIGEIRLRIAEQSQSEIIDVSSFTASFISSKEPAEGGDADFYTACAYDFIKTHASDVIPKFKPKHSTNAQHALPGFKHLQTAYPVKRQGRMLLVPIHLLSDDEIDARCEELSAMSKGCIAHQEELKDYKEQRRMDIAV